MKAEHRKQCEEMLVILQGMRRDGTVGENAYFKGVVSIAYEYMNDGEIKPGLDLLVMVPDSYFAKQQKADMMADHAYAHCCLVISQRLIQNGFIEDDEGLLLKFTQGQARA
jgi:hypothetical protein